MKELLQEAGDEFMAKEEELAKMASCLRDQEAEITQYDLRMTDLQVMCPPYEYHRFLSQGPGGRHHTV